MPLHPFDSWPSDRRLVVATHNPGKLREARAALAVYPIPLVSAGELGLVMNLCETSAPVSATYRPSPLVPSVQIFPVPADVVSSRLEAPSKLTSVDGVLA